MKRLIPMFSWIIVILWLEAKTFFRVNSSTCSEWCKRIRTAVNLIWLHYKEPELVIRYSEVCYHENLFLNKIKSSFFCILQYFANCSEKHKSSTSWSHSNLFSVCSLQLWGIRHSLWFNKLSKKFLVKTKHCKRFEWIQYVAELYNDI